MTPRTIRQGDRSSALAAARSNTMHSPPASVTRRYPEEDDRRRRDYLPQSPTHSHPYSPVNGTHPPSPYHQYSSRPSTSATMSQQPPAISPRLAPPPSPKTNGSTQNGLPYSHRESDGSTRYDPLSEHREMSGRKQSQYNTRSPGQVSLGPVGIEVSPAFPIADCHCHRLENLPHTLPNTQIKKFLQSHTTPRPVIFRSARRRYRHHMHTHQADMAPSHNLLQEALLVPQSIRKAASIIHRV